MARRALKDTTEDDPEIIDLVIDLMVRLRKSERTGSVSASEEAVDIAKGCLNHPRRSTHPAAHYCTYSPVVFQIDMSLPVQ